MQFILRILTQSFLAFSFLGCTSNPTITISKSTCVPRDILVRIQPITPQATHFEYALRRELVERGFTVSDHRDKVSGLLVVTLSTDIRGYGDNLWMDTMATTTLYSPNGDQIWSTQLTPNLTNIQDMINARLSGTTLSSRADQLADSLAEACVNGWRK
jgi:hypothetical protein